MRTNTLKSFFCSDLNSFLVKTEKITISRGIIIIVKKNMKYDYFFILFPKFTIPLIHNNFFLVNKKKL